MPDDDDDYCDQTQVGSVGNMDYDKPWTDLQTMAVILDKKSKYIAKVVDEAEKCAIELAVSSEEEKMKKLSAVGFHLRRLKTNCKALRAVVTGEDVPLGDVPMPPLGITEH